MPSHATTPALLPPQTPAIEAAVLGAAMLEADAQRLMLATLPDEQVFHRFAHQQVYAAIRDLIADGKHADQLTVVQQLRHRGTLQRVAGPAFVAGLTIIGLTHQTLPCRQKYRHADPTHLH